MKATRFLPLLGVLAVALLVVAFVILGETPESDDPVAKVVSFYRDHDADSEAAGILLMGAAAALLGWSIQLRSLIYLREGGSAPLATAGLVGTVMFAVGMTIFAGLNIALGDLPDKLPPPSIQLLNVLNGDLFAPLAVGAVVALFGYGAAVVRTRALPRWVGWVAIVGAVATFTPAWFLPFLALGVLILVSSVVMMMRPVSAPGTA